MIAGTRLAVLAVAGVLAGVAPAMATEPQTDPVESTTRFGATCTKGIAAVVMSGVPLYQDAVAVAKWFASYTAVPSSGTVSAVDAAKVFGGKVFEASFKKPSIGDHR